MCDIVMRCHPHVCSSWRSLALAYHENRNVYPTFEQFATFMDKVAREACDPMYGFDAFKITSKRVSVNFETESSSMKDDVVPSCISPKLGQIEERMSDVNSMHVNHVMMDEPSDRVDTLWNIEQQVETVCSWSVDDKQVHDMRLTETGPCSNQFGFQQKLGTDTCIYILKEIVEKYRSLNGCIFMCFLNASKAFERVKHSVLFSKLVRRGVPGYIVRLLCYWYDRQAMRVRWGNSLSDPFHVNNGVRQGGILSPYLFNVYMDDLSQSLNCCKTGCLSGEMMINHLMYADDLMLLSPSATGLQELLLACEKYSKEHATIYNSKKSSVLICKN